VLQEFKLEILTVRERKVGCSHVVREFEFGILTVENPFRNDRRKRISSLEAMIFQWTSCRLSPEVKRVNFSKLYTTIFLVSLFLFSNWYSAVSMKTLQSSYLRVVQRQKR
jgi:hypothetical protein